MNTKTTIGLAFLLGLLVLGYLALDRFSQSKDQAATRAPAPTGSSPTRDLIAEPLGNVTRIVARRGGEEWEFEKIAPEDGGTPAWQMIRPMNMKAVSHEVDRIAREAGRIQYEISYSPGEPAAVTAEQAGLTPPAVLITLSDDAGKSATVEIGKPASDNETYARLAGGDQIVVAKSNLRNLLKSKPLDYREMQLWNFVAEQATRVEITDRSGPSQGVDYVFVRDGSRWMMESPVAARATGKVDEMLRAISRLRVTAWQDDDPAKLAMFGLDPAPLAIRITVEEQEPAKDEDDTAEAEAEQADAETEKPTPQKRTTVYELQVSERGPIGEDTKVFVRSGNESAVGMIFKSAADKFKPAMSEWRDMQLMTADATKATRIELKAGGESATLVHRDGEWFFEGEEAKADAHAVAELLAAARGLKAVAFAEGPENQLDVHFENPQAEIRLTLPGMEGTEQFSVGSYSDPATRRLVYVRRGEGGVVAKVKAADVAALTQRPVTLRDRSVFDLKAENIQEITMTRAVEAGGEKQRFTLARSEGAWKMTAPTLAPAQGEAASKLVESLATLKAETVVAHDAEASSFGLHDPDIQITVVLREGEGDTADSDTHHAGSPSYEIALTRHEGKVYARRPGRDVIYELAESFHDLATAEFRVTDVFEFKAGDVQHLVIARGDEENSFVKKDGKWLYEAESDLPIDSARIDQVLTEAGGIKATRFAAYQSTDSARYGLDQPYFRLQAGIGDVERTLWVSEKTVEVAVNHAAEEAKGTPPAPHHYALLLGTDGVFLLNADKVRKVFVPLGDVEKK